MFNTHDVRRALNKYTLYTDLLHYNRIDDIIMLTMSALA